MPNHWVLLHLQTHLYIIYRLIYGQRLSEKEKKKVFTKEIFVQLFTIMSSKCIQMTIRKYCKYLYKNNVGIHLLINNLA